MPQKIWIFGDSFADIDHCPEDHPPKTYQWMRKLTRKYGVDNVQNFAKAASGPNYSIDQWVKQQLDYPEQCADTCVIFIESEHTRVHFEFLNDLPEPWRQVVAPWKFPPGHDWAHEKHRKYLEWFYAYYISDNFMKNEITKSLMTAITLASMHKKVLYWSLNDTVYHYKLMDHLKPSNLTYAGSGLRGWSFKERLDEGIKIDLRPNHMTKYTHYKMFHAFVRWIEEDLWVNPWEDFSFERDMPGTYSLDPSINPRQSGREFIHTDPDLKTKSR